MIDIYKELPRKIKVERAKRNWTQADLAEKIGMKQCQVSHWEATGAIPTMYYFIQLCKAFEMSPNELLEWDK